MMRDPEYNNTMYLYHSISIYIGWIYVLGIQICGMLIFYYAKPKVRGIIFANFSCLAISTIATAANYFLNLESFVMGAFLRRRVKILETLAD